MKKSVLIAAFFVCISVVSFAQQTENSVLVGQLYGTQPSSFFDKLKGCVKEMKQSNYLAGEENGKAVKIRVLTTEDRKTAPSGRDYFEEYDQYGIILKEGVLDEKGNLLEYWDVDTDSGKILQAFYYVNDILRNDIKVKYEGNNLAETNYYQPGTNILVKGIKYEYDESGNRTKFKFINSANMVISYNIYDYNMQGLVESLKAYNRAGVMTAIYTYTYNSKGHRITQHQETFADGDKRDYRFEYEFDKTGNYIKMVYYKDNKPLIYRERQIKYYE
jgi:hypothetical protein